MTSSPDAILHDIGLLSSESIPSLDAITRLAGDMLGVPVVLVSVVMPDEDRQFFKSMNGLPEPTATRRQTPLSHSYCKHVRTTDEPLIVTDTQNDARVCDNGATKDLGVAAYAGFPIHGPQDGAIGAFCVIDALPRDWSKEELKIVADFAEIVDDQVELLAAMHDRDLALQAEQEAAAAKSRLFANISHEVRTPLGGMLGLAELLSDQVVDATHRDMLKTIQISGKTLLHVLNDLLDVAKAEAGKIQLEHESFILRDIINQTVSLHKLEWTSKGIHISVEMASKLPSIIIGDQFRLQQILNNLFSNAVKFTHEGEVRLVVSEGDDPPDTLVFAISDSGIRMTTDQVTKLFTPFEQADSSTARRYGGTGLGTCIVAHLTELMGGTISVESSEGLGSTFRVSIPFTRAKESARLPQSPMSDQRLDGLCLLVADDNATNCKILEMFLGRAGAKVDIVTNGRAAVECATTCQYDAILLDISMPVMSGDEALTKIQRHFRGSGSHPPPVLAITANVMSEDVSAYGRHGFSAVVGKPFTKSELVTAVRSAVDQRPAG